MRRSLGGLIGEAFEVLMRWMVRVVCLAASVGACLAGAASAECQEIRDGSALLTAMHERYKDSWYGTVIFKENAITLNDDGTSKKEVWDEAVEVPGKLRINRGAASEGNGLILADNILTRFEKGKATGTRPFVHMLLVLGFDVYRQEAKKTIDLVKEQGFDLAQIHEEKWDGQDVYVVGAAKGNLKARQFWIEKKRLLFVRLIAPDEQDATKIHDTRFLDYRKLTGGWISARVEFYTNGKNTFNEDYFDIKANERLEPALFDPAKFNETKISYNANR
ncbi:MAG TPA: hypothetical protein VMI32_07160 [Candidatus Solibacter sp.]|nr:hypothetical protein [Candidatus Solibacter sp.]